jgi:PhzF family phenazine biosynthesis protein
MPQPIYVADAFTDRPFAGNPAAVCPLDRPADAAWMARVAAEMNLSETAFLDPVPGGWNLRWFTPTVEVELCGHATLAGAHVLWESGRLAKSEPARFQTRSGPLTAVARGPEIELDFPAQPVESGPPPEGLIDGLGAAPVWVGGNGTDSFVVLADEKAVRSLRPDLARLRRIAVRGVVVTSRCDAGPYDFVSRFFAPASGVDEDPVTGTAHCALGPYWAERFGKSDLVGFQASARGGVVRVGVRGRRVLLGGSAVTVWRGELVDGPP